MKHAWILLFAIGCGGGGGGGEPLMGNVAVQYGTAMPDMTTGSAVQSHDNPMQMVIQIGSDHVDCSTDLSGTFFTEQGTYVFFNADKTMPSTNAQADITVENVSGNHIDLNGATGTVTISTIDTRVTGSVMLTTTDSMVGTITATGNFDVKRCF